MSEQIVGVLIGGGLALLGGLVVAITSEVRGRGEWRRQARLSAASKAIGALQLLNREITNLAISPITTVDGTGHEWDAFHAATVGWNTARHEAALMCPAAELTSLANAKLLPADWPGPVLRQLVSECSDRFDNPVSRYVASRL